MPSLNAKSVIGGITSSSNSTSNNSNSNSHVSNGSYGSNHFPQKLRNFFRINSSTSSADHTSTPGSSHSHSNSSEKAGHHEKGILSLRSDSGNTTSKTSFRQSKFFTTVGRLRSTTVASEGNMLEESLSPTAFANPYFAHQGQPGIRHHNEGSQPPSPPDTPSLRVLAAHGSGSPTAGSAAVAAAAAANGERTTAASKEELARKLRRVASAPNAQGLFSKAGGSAGAHGASTGHHGLPLLGHGFFGNGKDSDERPKTAELGKEPVVMMKNASGLGLIDSKKASALNGSGSPPGANGHSGARPLAHESGVHGNGDEMGVDKDELGALPLPGRSPLTFRSTYSSNSIKVRNVEVGPQSFDKIKLIGKGDVGKVYLVREKKSSRLYAMKGSLYPPPLCYCSSHRCLSYLANRRSVEQKGNDQAQQDQACSR